jgi:N6-L-threonylcarbamoyladenine synthase
MIAVAGLKRLEAGEHDDLAIEARAQWPLESLTPPGIAGQPLKVDSRP